MIDSLIHGHNGRGGQRQRSNGFSRVLSVFHRPSNSDLFSFLHPPSMVDCLHHLPHCLLSHISSSSSIFVSPFLFYPFDAHRACALIPPPPPPLPSSVGLAIDVAVGRGERGGGGRARWNSRTRKRGLPSSRDEGKGGEDGKEEGRCK